MSYPARAEGLVNIWKKVYIPLKNKSKQTRPNQTQPEIGLFIHCNAELRVKRVRRLENYGQLIKTTKSDADKWLEAEKIQQVAHLHNLLTLARFSSFNFARLFKFPCHWSSTLKDCFCDCLHKFLTLYSLLSFIFLHFLKETSVIININGLF